MASYPWMSVRCSVSVQGLCSLWNRDLKICWHQSILEQQAAHKSEAEVMLNWPTLTWKISYFGILVGQDICHPHSVFSCYDCMSVLLQPGFLIKRKWSHQSPRCLAEGRLNIRLVDWMVYSLARWLVSTKHSVWRDPLECHSPKVSIS